MLDEPDERRSWMLGRLPVRWAVVLAVGCVAYGFTAPDGAGMAVTATAAAVAVAHKLLE